MIGDLNHLVVIKVSPLPLHVVALVVLVEEAGVVAIWTDFSIVQLFMIITNSLHVLWSINNVWIVWRVVISFFESN